MTIFETDFFDFQFFIFFQGGTYYEKVFANSTRWLISLSGLLQKTHTSSYVLSNYGPIKNARGPPLECIGY